MGSWARRAAAPLLHAPGLGGYPRCARCARALGALFAFASFSSRRRCAASILEATELLAPAALGGVAVAEEGRGDDDRGDDARGRPDGGVPERADLAADAKGIFGA